MLKIIGGKSVENLNVATPQPKISIITRGDISSPALHETNLLNSLGEKRFSQFINQIKESIEDKSNLVQAIEGLSAEQRINLNKIFSEIDEEIFDLFLAKVFTLDSLDLIDFIENADKLSFESVIKRINNVAVNFDAKLDKLEELAQFNIYSKLENLYQLDGSDISILEIDPQENKKYGVLKKNFKKALQLLAPENDGDVIQYAFPTHPELKHYHSVYLKRINSNELIAHIYDNEQNIRFPLTGLKKYHSNFLKIFFRTLFFLDLLVKLSALYLI